MLSQTNEQTTINVISREQLLVLKDYVAWLQNDFVSYTLISNPKRVGTYTVELFRRDLTNLVDLGWPVHDAVFRGVDLMIEIGLGQRTMADILPVLITLNKK